MPSFVRVGRRSLLGWGISFLAVPLLMGLHVAAAGKIVIVQTNAAGNQVSLIDPTTDTVIAEVKGVEVIHGAAASPDGNRLYLANESTSTVDVVEVKTLKIIKSIPLSGHPNNIAIGRDGRRLYQAIINRGAGPGGTTTGGIDVIDTASLEKVKYIDLQALGLPGGCHNTFITPDSKHVVCGNAILTVFDTATDQLAWKYEFDKLPDGTPDKLANGSPRGIRPLTFTKNSDGSTKEILVQLTDWHGFAVLDFTTRKEVRRVKTPDPAPGEGNTAGLQGAPSHGIVIAPDGKTVWSTSKVTSRIYGYSIPDFKLIAEIQVGMVPDWLTFTPDGKKVYVANAGSGYTSAVDVAAKKEIAKIKVGQVPKRNITATLNLELPTTN